jgi:hypothetical protein
MSSTQTLQDALSAFKAVLDAANIRDVTVYQTEDYAGTEQRCIILTIVSVVDREPSIGSRISGSARALEQWFRLQVDCYYDDSLEVLRVADQTQQALLDNRDRLETTSDIHNLKTFVVVPSRPDPLNRLWRVRMDFGFYTHRGLT